MRAIPRVLWVAVLAVLLVTSVAVEPASASELPQDQEAAFIGKLNALRAEKGLAPLSTKGPLFEMARSWSARMLAARGISHNPSLAAQGPQGWRRLGENVGMGYDVQGLHDAFVASPTHYRNMVDPAFDSVGVGIVHAPDGQIFVTVDFMTTATASPAQATKAKRVCRRNSRGRLVCSRR